uniref:Uncharacterized protein n=1 Tax=Panagrolaimus sp. PS1159 TaxID=55785 RepID=A0AC35GME5_9BILA
MLFYWKFGTTNLTTTEQHVAKIIRLIICYFTCMQCFICTIN